MIQVAIPTTFAITFGTTSPRTPIIQDVFFVGLLAAYVAATILTAAAACHPHLLIGYNA